MAGLAIAEAATALHQGRLLALDRPEGWCVIGRVQQREAILALPGIDAASVGLSAGSGDLLASLLPPLPLRAQRLVERLLPGALALSTPDLAHLRLPDHPLWAALAGLRDPLLLGHGIAAVPAGVVRLDGGALADETRVHVRGGDALRLDAIGTLDAAAVAAAAGINLLCVCTGNTCRSPLLEGLLRRACTDRGLAEVHVTSAGTSAGNGEPASAHTVTILARRGIDARAHRSQHIEDLELALYDRFLCMTGSHAAALAHLGVPADRIALVDPSGIPDPYGGPLSAYEATAAAMDAAIDRILAGI